MPIIIKDKSSGVTTTTLPSETNQIVVYDGTSGASVKPAPVVITDTGEFQRVGSGVISLFEDADTTQIDMGSTSIPVIIAASTLTLGSTGGTVNVEGSDINVGDTGGQVDILGNVNVGETGATLALTGTTINIGESGATVNIIGDTSYQNVTNLDVTDKNILVNKGGAAASGGTAGIDVEENSVVTGYAKVAADRDAWEFKAPNQTGVASIETDGDSFTVDKTIVKGPTSGTDNRLVKSDGTTGRVVQESGIAVDDSNNMSGIGTIGSGTITSTGDVDAVNVSVSGKVETAETANRALTTDASGDVTASTTTDTELGYVSGVTSSIQTQLDAKQTKTLSEDAVLVGNASNEAAEVDTTTIGDIEADVTAGLTIKSAAVTGPKLGTNAVTSSKINAGAVTDAKVASGIDAAKLADGSVSNTELQYINSLSSNAQDQIDGKVDKITSTDNAVTRYDGTSGDVQDSGVTIDDSDNVAGVNNIDATTADLGSLNVSTDTISNASGQVRIDATTKVLLNQDTKIAGTIAFNYEGNNTSGSNVTLATPTEGLTNLINAGLVSVDMITAPTDSSAQKFTLHNDTGNAITLSNDTGATAANRITTGTGADLTLENDASVDVIYSANDSRWLVVGGTGAGSGVGGINYIVNYDFEKGVDNWTGDTNLVISQETTSPLRGDGSLKIAKAAADASDEVVYADTFAVDDADLAKMIYGSFDYDFSDANYTDGDAVVEVIQDPSGTPITIRPNGEDIQAGKGTHYFRFQTDHTEADYRVQIRWVDTGTNAVNAYIDNVIVGPRSVVYGSPMTDWQEYDLVIGATTTAPTKATVTVQDKAYWRRVGDSMEVTFEYRHAASAGAAAGSGSYKFEIPPGYTIDNTKLTPDTSGFVTVGSATVNSTSTGFMTGTCTYAGSNSVYLFVGSNTAADASVKSTFAPLSDATAIYGASFSVPIQGWSSNAQMSEDLGGQVYSELILDGGSSHGSTNTKIKRFTTVVNQLGGAFTYEDSATLGGTININKTDIYSISYKFSGSTGGIHAEGISKNSTQLTTSVQSVTAADLLSGYVEADTALNHVFYGWAGKLEKGDILRVHTDATNTGGVNKLTIATSQNTSTVFETETVAARYTSNSGQTLNSTLSVITYEDLEEDTHGMYNTSTGVITIPAKGTYDIKTGVRTASATWSLGDALTLSLEIEGVNEVVIASNISQAAGTYVKDVRLIDEREYNKGDEIKVECQSSVSTSAETNPRATFLSITRTK